MLKKVKVKARALIRSEARQAVEEVQATFENNMRQILREELSSANVNNAAPDLSSVRKQLRQAISEKNPDNAKRILSRFAKDKRESNARYLEEARRMRIDLYRAENKEAYKDAIKVLFDSHTFSDFTRDQFSDVYNFRFPITQASSMFQQFVRRRRMKQLGDVPDRWLVKSKKEGEEFAQMVDVLCPKSQYNIPFDQIPHMTDIVVKPMASAGSKGVFMVRALDDILSLEDHTKLNSWDEMREQVQTMLKNKRISEDAFVYQQCIYSSNTTKEPAHDLKFYTFYGEVGAVLEIARYPEKAFWWWTPDGQPIEIEAVNPASMKPEGFTPEMLQTAIDLSLKIPSPFMRLDFMRNEDKLYLSEFCSSPGAGGARTLGRYYPKWDRIFGDLYLKAEMQIVNDLLAGKRFDEINEFNRICDKRYRNK